MIVSRYKATFDRWLEPAARVAARSGVSPTQLTLLGLGLVAASCAVLLVTKQRLLFCVLVAAASMLDALDGAVARLTHRTSRLGSYLDAVCDRYAEVLVVCTVAAVTGYWLPSLLVLSGSLLVSYAKARASMEVPVSNLEWPDLMERAERGICFISGLALSALVPWRPLGQDLFWWTLVILGGLVHATAAQRIRRAARLIQGRGV